MCDQQLNKFLDVCNEISFPVALEKSYWGTMLLTFLGLLLDSENQRICIPLDKIEKAQEMIHILLNRRSKKAKVMEFQKLCGFLGGLSLHLNHLIA